LRKRVGGGKKGRASVEGGRGGGVTDLKSPLKRKRGRGFRDLFVLDWRWEGLDEFANAKNLLGERGFMTG